jgi:hypothetical protein
MNGKIKELEWFLTRQKVLHFIEVGAMLVRPIHQRKLVAIIYLINIALP